MSPGEIPFYSVKENANRNPKDYVFRYDIFS